MGNLRQRASSPQFDRNQSCCNITTHRMPDRDSSNLGRTPFPPVIVGLMALMLASAFRLSAQSSDEFEQAPIRYSATTPDDAVQKLEQQLLDNELTLEGNDGTILRKLLATLDVPVESQLLVFSKTSLQRTRISPTTPRALFFSDDVYVGWVPGGLIEVTTIDPSLGPVFYSFDPRSTPDPAKPRFFRDEDCLRCHGGQFVRGIPSVFARSLYTDDTGEPMLRFGSEVIDDRTPFEQRWGGWYVTGTHGTTTHRGNVFSREEKERLVVDFNTGANITNLGGFFNTARYPAASSDIVALLVFEHQLAMHNAITRAGFQCRRMLHYQTNVQHDLGETVTTDPTYDSVRRVFDNAAQDVVDHLLFFEEAPLPEGGVWGDGRFQSAFHQRARRSKAGDSLRDLDLNTRVFRNRCSFLIDSDSFAALPSPLLKRIYARLERALRATNADPRYSHLGPAEKLRILTILRETHKGLPAAWAE